MGAFPHLDSEEKHEVNDDFGLLLLLEPDGTVTANVVEDSLYQNIHPHCFAPASLRDERILKGGGSGTTVFAGFVPELNEVIVMKHGNHRDTGEVFALVDVSIELQKRSFANPDAAQDMARRIPAFAMAYISPHHLRNRAREKWKTLRKVVSRWNRSSLKQAMASVITEGPENGTRRGSLLQKNSERLKRLNQHDKSFEKGAKINVKKDDIDMRRISIECRNCTRNAGSTEFVQVENDLVHLVIPGLGPDGKIASGMEFLTQLAPELEQKQAANNWKITLGQKRIGGPDSCNGASVLIKHELNGSMLDMLINQFEQVMKNLQSLTYTKEKDVLGRVQDELKSLHETRDVTQVSTMTDGFVGSSILKNFHPEKGRFAKLRKLGEDFREGSLHLEEHEVLPSLILGEMLQPGVDLSEIFVMEPGVKSPFNFLSKCYMKCKWLEVLDLATSIQDKSATELIWTAGLTDSGLHNAFLSPTRGLELFDLGEPKLTTLPGFLTKFLMSFWHCWGMEDMDDGTPTWVNRFTVEDGKVSLTEESKTAIPYIHTVYQTVVCHFTSKIFNGDNRVKKLLASYVTLQLVSDAAFCLERWIEKGGGAEKHGAPHEYQAFMDKWLWRGIWDLYVAFEVRERYIVSDTCCIKPSQ